MEIWVRLVLLSIPLTSPDDGFKWLDPDFSATTGTFSTGMVGFSSSWSSSLTCVSILLIGGGWMEILVQVVVIPLPSASIDELFDVFGAHLLHLKMPSGTPRRCEQMSHT